MQATFRSKIEMFLDSVVEGSIDGIFYANYFYMLGFVIDSSLTFTWKENFILFCHAAIFYFCCNYLDEILDRRNILSINITDLRGNIL
jgi:hypothetical protein